MFNFCFLTPKSTSLHGAALFDVFYLKIGSVLRLWGVGRTRQKEAE